MKKLFPILPFLALLLTACTGDPAVDAVHNTADSLMAVNRPDSALQLIHSLDSSLRLPSFGRTERGLSHRQRMRHELLRAKAMNKAYVDFTTDSVMKLVADYYDRHGTPNERMEAHYLLGCTYRDMGEAPRAVDCFLDAVACADTTQADCDFYTLASIHAQTARLYHQQLLLSYEVEEHRKASHFNFLAKDTLHALFEKKMIAGVYILKNMKDSAEAVILNVMGLYDNSGLVQEGLQTSLMLMHLYAELPDRLSELKELIDNYDSKSSYFDKSHELHYDRKQFYFYKGVYFSKINQLDSAEYYFRKLYFPGMPLTAKNYMYDGLLRVFRNRHLADSIDKYAQLYCEVNDSSIAIKDQELTARMGSSYNYSRYQKKSKEEADKAHRANIRFVTILSLAIIMAIAFAYWVKNYRSRQRQKQKELDQLKSTFADTLDMYEHKVQELQRLESTHKKVLGLLQKELGHAKCESEKLKMHYSIAKQEIESINATYQEDKERLTEEIRSLKMKIDSLKMNSNISEYVEQTASFSNTEILRRIKAISASPKATLSAKDMTDLIDAAATYYPALMNDLSLKGTISQNIFCTCILVTQNFRTDDIAHLLGVTGQRVTNIKAEINQVLFNEKAAKPLLGNLKKKYGIFPC